MKITAEPIDGTTIILEEVFNSIILRTAEGNEFAICMRDDTVEMKVCGDDPHTDEWYRADMKTGEVTVL